MMQDPKVLVIGSGGGRDVVASLVSGSKDVTSVEINPIIYETVKSYGDEAGNVYSHEHVRSFVDEGRSCITRSSEKYDIIYVVCRYLGICLIRRPKRFRKLPIYIGRIPAILRPSN